MATLALAIKSLRDTEKLIPVLEDLGRRHALYGVRDEYYETVGAALLESLREALGEEFTSEGAAAWGEMYGFVAATMKNAAREMSEHPERSKTIEEPPKMSNPLNIATQVILTSLLIACLSFGAIAQKESASRGRPANRAIAANGSFQMKFALYDAQGDQIGQTKENQSGAPAD